jgi:hypothetical protein
LWQPSEASAETIRNPVTSVTQFPAIRNRHFKSARLRKLSNSKEEHEMSTAVKAQGARWVAREVRDGDRLSGHGNDKDGYPEISVHDRSEHEALMFRFDSFHWAIVKITDTASQLLFEGKTLVSIDKPGVVVYHELAKA